MVDIERLQQLVDAATPGPWTHGELGTAALGYDVDEVPCGIRGMFEREEDAEFIAESRNAMPDLLAELRTLRALRDKMEAAPTAWTLSVVEDDEPWLVSNRWAVCEAERRLTGGVLSQAKLVPVENVQ